MLCIDVNDNEEMEQKSHMNYILWLFYLVCLFMVAPGVALKRSNLDEVLSEDSLM